VWRPSACSFIPLQPESFAEQHALTTITFAGDSMMRQAFISFVCQMRRVALKYKLNWWDKFGPSECPFGKAHCYFDARPYILAESCVYLWHNLTVCYRNQVDVCHHRHEPDRKRRHICVFNVGFNQIDDPEGFGAYLRATESVIQRRRARVQYIWRETVPTHFATAVGDGRFPGHHDALCGARQSTAQHWSNTLANAAMARLGVPILFVEQAAMTEWASHVDRMNRFIPRNDSQGRTVHRPHHDCTHFCLPGPPDSWVAQLLTMLHALAVRRTAAVHK